MDRNEDPSHVHHPSPGDPSICLGCWIATIELEKWAVRARPDRVFMSPWAEQWLAEIVKDPKKIYRQTLP
jgi:hypothetical protein